MIDIKCATYTVIILCRSQIKKLEAEQEELQKDLKLIESSSNQARNEKACESLGELGRKKRTLCFN